MSNRGSDINANSDIREVTWSDIRWAGRRVTSTWPSITSTKPVPCSSLPLGDGPKLHGSLPQKERFLPQNSFSPPHELGHQNAALAPRAHHRTSGTPMPLSSHEGDRPRRGGSPPPCLGHLCRVQSRALTGGPNEIAGHSVIDGHVEVTRRACPLNVAPCHLPNVTVRVNVTPAIRQVPITTRSPLMSLSRRW